MFPFPKSTQSPRAYALKHFTPITGGAEMGVDDNASSANFATVQAYIDYLQSSAGASDIRCIAPETGGVSRTLNERTLDIFSRANYSTDQQAVTAAANAALYYPEGTYNIATGVTTPDAIRIYGAGMALTSWNWTGGAGTIFTADATCNSLIISGIQLDNHGTADAGIAVNCVRATLDHIYSNPATKFGTAIISTNVSTTVYHFVIRDSLFAASAVGEETPIGLYLARGHTFTVENCMFSGLLTAIKAGGGGGQPAQQVNIVNGRIETFAGVTAGYPGSATALGIDANDVWALNVIGVGFEIDGNGEAAGAGNRAIKLNSVNGGEIAACFMSGTGQATAFINIADAAALNVIIAGNDFYNANGYAVETTGSGKLYNCEIGTNNCHGAGMLGSYDDSIVPTFSAGVTFGAPGTKTFVGTWKRVHKMIHWQLEIIPTGGTTVAAAAGSYFTTSSAYLAAVGNRSTLAVVDGAPLSIGVGLSNAADNRHYLPAWTARTDNIIMSGSYPITI